MGKVENPVQDLWQHQPVEGIQMSVEELRRRAGKFERTIYWRNVGEYVGALVALGPLAYFFATTHDVLSRVSFGLFIAAMVWIVVQLHRKGSSRKLPNGVDTLTGLRFYRAELERQLEALRSVWSWYLAPLVPGFVVYTIGHAVKVPRPASWAGLALMNLMVAVLFVWIWRMNQKAARCCERMIEELNGVD
jgi:hypothetical protein